MPAYYHGILRLGMVVLIACGGAQKREHKPGQEYLAAIKFEGNHHIEDKTLRNGLALNDTLESGGVIDEYLVNLDTTRIVGAYQRHGYWSVAVRTHVARSGDATTLIFTVDEGPRAKVRVEITGLPPEVALADARALVKLEDGADFEYGPFDSAKVQMLAMVENQGYAHAQLDAAVLADRATNSATLRYAIDAGPRVKFGEVTVAGVEGVLGDAARDRVRITPGDWYSPRALAETQQAIYGLRRFESVRVDIDRTSLATVLPVKINLTEGKRLELRAGGGLGLDTLTAQIRGRAGATYSRGLTTMSLELKPALFVTTENCDFLHVSLCEEQWRLRAIATVVQQDLFRPYVKGEAEGGADYLQLEAYRMQGFRARLGIGSPILTPKVEARVGWIFGYYEFHDVHPLIDPATAARLGIDHNERLGAFTQSVSLDLRDNPIEPTIGAYAELRVAEGGSYALGAYNYTQVTPDLRGYVPFDRFVIAGRARLGLILGNDVPPTERYYAGGAGSQRGFSDRRLSPTLYGTDMDGKPISVVIGGAAELETGVELRTRLQRGGAKLGGVLFLDGGDVTETVGELDVTRLHWAVGAGVRSYYLPFGPIRLELAYRLNRYGAGEPQAGDSIWNRFEVVLGVGEAY